MSVIEPCAAAAFLAGAVAGEMAGSRGGILFGIGGTLAGGSMCVIATMMTVVITGLVMFAIGYLTGQRELFDEPQEPAAPPTDPPAPPSKLQEALFFLVLSPVLFAPLWASWCAYQLIASVVGRS